MYGTVNCQVCVRSWCQSLLSDQQVQLSSKQAPISPHVFKQVCDPLVNNSPTQGGCSLVGCHPTSSETSGSSCNCWPFNSTSGRRSGCGRAQRQYGWHMS